MKNYIDKNNGVYSYDDNISKELLEELIKKNGLTPILDEALLTLRLPNLEEAKTAKKQEMISEFSEVSIEPVHVNGITYNGGFDAALKLDGAKRLVELAGLTEVTFYGIDNKPKVLSIAEANTVILAISAKYQTDFAHLQELKVLIDSKQKVSTVETVNW